jgi:hypothetical protein
MTLRAWASWQYDEQGWTLASAARTAGTGQSGLASIRSTSGSAGEAKLGIAADGELIVGFCWKHTNIIDAGVFYRLHFAGFIALDLSVGAAGEIVATRNASTEIGRSVAGLLSSNVENWIEVRVLGSTTVGQVEVRMNGAPTPVLNLTGVHTGSATYDEIVLRTGGSGTRDFSAFYYVEVDATAPNTFLGHIRFGIPVPNGNGNSSQLVGSDGNSVDNYLLVDDPPLTHDGDSTYVQSATVGEKDTYGMSNLPTPALSIVAVCPLIIAKKTDAGSRAIKAVVRRSGTDYDAAVEHFLSTSYASYKQALLVDPSTSAAWTEAGVNAMELGVKVTT